tara:strand:- start:10 stop:594 length:585 start_codon:yes stop_codon:yes gene_type:complete
MSKLFAVVNFVTVSVVALVASVVFWDMVKVSISSPEPPYEIGEMVADGLIIPGEAFVIVVPVVKRFDCPGTYSWRLIDVSGRRFALENGFLGDNEPGEYLYRKALVAPLAVAPGQAELKVVTSMTCDGMPTSVQRRSLSVNVKVRPSLGYIAPETNHSASPAAFSSSAISGHERPGVYAQFFEPFGSSGRRPLP